MNIAIPVKNKEHFIPLSEFIQLKKVDKSHLLDMIRKGHYNHCTKKVNRRIYIDQNNFYHANYLTAHERAYMVDLFYQTYEKLGKAIFTTVCEITKQNEVRVRMYLADARFGKREVAALYQAAFLQILNETTL